MKLFTNIPGNLRALFGFLRITTILMGTYWVLTFTFNSWIQNRFIDEPKLIVTVGEIALPTAPGAVQLSSDTAKPGSLALGSLRGTLQMDLCSKDPGLVSALRLAILPSMLTVIIFSYAIFTSLRSLCANIEHREVFTDKNLSLVRGIGITFIVYSLVGSGLEIWASHVLGGYFSQHVMLAGLKSDMPFGSNFMALQFTLRPGFLTNQGGLVTGCLFLVVAEAFRQGLKLKTENDLTV